MTVYATADQLAAALHVAVSVKNSADLEACVEAASTEIDQYCDRVDIVLPVPTPALVNRVCVGRGVEHWKAADAAFGAVGFDNTGVLTARVDTFERWARMLIPYKVQFGIG